MNVCILSKFPPLEGGIAAKTYWLARAYAEAKLSVHVVSNAGVAEPVYCIKGCYPHVREIPGVTLHEVETDLPWHIPEEPHSLVGLVDKALEVVEEYRIDVIDTGYLIPYGIAGYLVNRIAGVPYVVRHGGSDLAKFLKAGRFRRLLGLTLDDAATIVTDTLEEATLAPFTAPLKSLAPYVPDPEHFNPSGRPKHEAPVLLYAGKINWHWERKGLDRIVRCGASLPDGWKLRWVGQGKGVERFQEFSLRETGMRVKLNGFVPPWEVPAALRAADYVFALSVEEPIPSFSNVVAEAMGCGTFVIVDEDFDAGPYAQGCQDPEAFLVRVPAEGSAAMVKKLVNHWEQAKTVGLDQCSGRTEHDRYCQRNVETLCSAAELR